MGEAIMIIKSSAVLRNDYASISDYPIYITRNGEGDVVLMNIEAFEKREQILKLRERVLQAEQERIDGAKTYSIFEAREQLRKRIDGV